MKLPIYKATITEDDDELGVDTISFVQSPAMEYSYEMFSEDVQLQQFQIQSNDKRIVRGVLILADTPIYRNNSRFGEHYVVFTKEDVEALSQKYFKNKHNFSFNMEHDSDKLINSAYVYESYIVDREMNVEPPKTFSDVPDGSWLVSVKVEDEKEWKMLKESEFKGFSIEGIFAHVLHEVPMSKEERKVKDALSYLKNQGI